MLFSIKIKTFEAMLMKFSTYSPVEPSCNITDAGKPATATAGIIRANPINLIND